VPTRALQQITFGCTKVPFPQESQVISGIPKFPQKGWESPELFYYQGWKQRRERETFVCTRVEYYIIV